MNVKPQEGQTIATQWAVSATLIVAPDWPPVELPVFNVEAYSLHRASELVQSMNVTIANATGGSLFVKTITRGPLTCSDDRMDMLGKVLATALMKWLNNG